MTQVEAPLEVHTAAAHVAAEVRAEMSRQRFTQTRLRMALGLSQSTMSRRYTGEHPWDVGQLAAIADVLGLPPGRFFETPPLRETSQMAARNDTAVTRPTNPCYSAGRLILGPWATPVSHVTAA